MTNSDINSKINPFTFGENNRKVHEDFPLTKDEIGDQSRQLLTTFIKDRLYTSNMNYHISAEMLIEPGTPAGPQVSNINNVAETLKFIGDQLDNDADLQKHYLFNVVNMIHSLIDKVPCNAPAAVLLDVSIQLFKDHNYNWGRIVALFYFAFKLILKVLKDEVSNQLGLMRSIIEWTVSFIVKHVANWILEQGGWVIITIIYIYNSFFITFFDKQNYITEYLSSTLKQTIYVLSAGLVMAGIVIVKNSIVDHYKL